MKLFILNDRFFFRLVKHKFILVTPALLLLVSINVHSAPFDAPFFDDPTNLYHIFSDYYDASGVEKWCEGYISDSEQFSSLRSCSPSFPGSPNISCDGFIGFTTNFSNVCRLEFRCIHQDGPNAGEWALDQWPTPGAGGYCPGSVDGPKNMGGCCSKGKPDPKSPKPIHLGTGNKFLTETDYQSNVSGGLAYRRYYNSLATQDKRDFGMAFGWRTDYFQYVEMFESVSTLEVNRPDGQRLRFYKTSSGVLVPFGTDVLIKALELTDGQGATTGWKLTLTNDSVEEYDATGRLLSITNRAGQTQTLDYNVTVANGGDDNPLTLDKVTDHFGRSLSFTYHAVLVINTMTDPNGGVYTFGYGSANGQLLLTGMTYPDETPADLNDNPVRQYHYEDTTNPLSVTGITDETGKRYSNYAYDNQGRAIMSELANGIGRVDVVYNADGTTTVTDSEGQVLTYHFENIHGVINVAQIDGGPCASCGSDNQYTTYDNNGFVSSSTDFNGNQTTYINNSRGLETSRTEAVGTPEERTITTEWHPTFRLPTKITEPGKTTTFTYDAQGRLLESKEETAP